MTVHPIQTHVVTYFIQAVEGGPIKIGRSTQTSLLNRLSSIQTGNPLALRVTHILEGDQQKQLHHRFEAHRLAGEWFNACSELAELARAIPEIPDSIDRLAGHQAGFLEGWQEGAQFGFKLARETLDERITRVLEEEHHTLNLDAPYYAMDAFKDRSKGAARLPDQQAA